MAKHTLMIGRVFGRLTVVAPCPDRRRRHWECVCTCGGGRAVRDDCLKSGNTQSCGCLQRERTADSAKTHGRYDTPEYTCWVNMLQRCMNKGHRHYSGYGGRGITVCPEWLFFENFYRDMGDRPSEDHTLDREDNDGNYCKENCRWVTQKQQMNNTRSVRKLSHNGITHTVTEWAELLHMSPETLRTRLRLGWPISDALTIPVKQKKAVQKGQQ